MALAKGEVGLGGTLGVGVVKEAAGVEGVADALAVGEGVAGEGGDDVFGGFDDDDFRAFPVWAFGGFEAVRDAGPVVAKQAGAGAGDLEDAGGG